MEIDNVHTNVYNLFQFFAIMVDKTVPIITQILQSTFYFLTNLDNIFPGQWIKRQETTQWSARSPGFFVLGSFKMSDVHKPRNLQDLEARIRLGRPDIPYIRGSSPNFPNYKHHISEQVGNILHIKLILFFSCQLKYTG